MCYNNFCFLPHHIKPIRRYDMKRHTLSAAAAIILSLACAASFLACDQQSPSADTEDSSSSTLLPTITRVIEREKLVAKFKPCVAKFRLKSYIYRVKIRSANAKNKLSTYKGEKPWLSSTPPSATTA